MIRKMLVIAAAIAMPVSVVAVTGGVAGAKKAPTPPDPAVTCSVSATVTFAPPGISQAGSASPAKTSTTTTSATTFGGGCTGGGTGNNIVSKSTKCAKKVGQPEPTSNPGCQVGEYGYGSWANFTSGGTASIQKALKKLSFTINGIAYATKTTGSSEIINGVCGGDVGFQITGVVSAPKQDKGQSSTLNACLGAITGSGLKPGDNFFNAAVDEQGTVATAAIDPSVSTVHIS
jgi:hypothetical protein